MSDLLEEGLESVPTRSRRHNKEARKDLKKHDARGSSMVKCNICLTWECRLDNLASHVKKFHTGSWKSGANRNQFVLKADAAQPEASSGKHDL